MQSAPPQTSQNDFVITPSNSIPQKSDLSTGSEKKVDGKRDLAPRKADKAEKKIEKLEKEKAEAAKVYLKIKFRLTNIYK